MLRRKAFTGTEDGGRGGGYDRTPSRERGLVRARPDMQMPPLGLEASASHRSVTASRRRVMRSTAESRSAAHWEQDGEAEILTLCHVPSQSTSKVPPQQTPPGFLFPLNNTTINQNVPVCSRRFMFVHADECVRRVSAQRGLGPGGEFFSFMQRLLQRKPFKKMLYVSLKII